MQEKEAQNTIQLSKVKGLRNPADVGTKHLSEDLIVAHLRTMGAQFESGRAETAPELLFTLDEAHGAPSSSRRVTRQQRRSWTSIARGTWSKEFKGARALRTTDSDGPSWDQVIHCHVEDKHSGEVLFNRFVGDTHRSDPTLHAVFKCPRDIVVTLRTRARACTLGRAYVPPTRLGALGGGGGGTRELPPFVTCIC